MIEVLSSGIQTTVQDCGRVGYMHLGIARSGAMDEISSIVANRLLGVADNNPLLECTLIGPTLKFHQTMTIAITGAQMHCELDGMRIPNQQVITISAGSVLKCMTCSSGLRSYIAFDHKMVLTEVLHSFATQVGASIGGYQGRALEQGDLIQFSALTRKSTHYSAPLINYSGVYHLRFTESPETDYFSATQIARIQTTKYQVSKDSNRMGVRLVGEAVTFNKYQTLASRGLLAGAIQIPPNGLPIIAGKDAQTTGGYLRIGQIIAADLAIIGQLKSNDEIQFQQITLQKAREIRAKQLSLLNSHYA